MEHLLWDSNYAICQESANFFLKGPNSKYFRHCKLYGQHCHCSMEAALIKKYTSEHGCVPITLSLQTPVVACIWLASHSWWTLLHMLPIVIRKTIKVRYRWIYSVDKEIGIQTDLVHRRSHWENRADLQ